jgi:hypothetical protein
MRGSGSLVARWTCAGCNTRGEVEWTPGTPSNVLEARTA